MKQRKFRSRDSFYRWYSDIMLTDGSINDRRDLVEVGKIFESFLLYNTYDIDILAEFVFFCGTIIIDKNKHKFYSKLLRQRIREARKIAFPTLKDLLE